MNIQLIGRTNELFIEDMARHEAELQKAVSEGRFLVVGGAGSIGQNVVKEIFRRNPKALHVVDISENDLIELEASIRWTFGDKGGDFQTFPLDSNSFEFNALVASRPPYDYILNLSAQKHLYTLSPDLRSPSFEFILMRMIEVNIFNADRLAAQAIRGGSRKYFGLSSDGAAGPVNMVEASRRIMELFLMRRSLEVPVSMARFANVALFDGSLRSDFEQKIHNHQPITAPRNVWRYFLTPKEAGELCLMSCLLGENRDIFFPKPSEQLFPITASEIAARYLESVGYEAYACSTEEEASSRFEELSARKKWPCYFYDSDTPGEKEAFYTEKDTLDMDRFSAIGVIKNEPVFDAGLLDEFEGAIRSMRDNKGDCSTEALVELFRRILPGSTDYADYAD